MVRDSRLVMQGITFCENELIDISRKKNIMNYVGPSVECAFVSETLISEAQLQRIPSFFCLVSLNCYLQPEGRNLHLQLIVTFNIYYLLTTNRAGAWGGVVVKALLY